MDKWLQNNNMIKLIALCLAVMLWLSVNDATLTLPREREASTTIRNVTLEARYDHDRYDVIKMPQTVDLSLRGDRFAMNMVSPERYKAYVDLTKMGAGVHKNVPVRVEGLRGVEVEARPAKVDVVMEEKQQKEMPVEVDVIGKPHPDYKVGEPIVQPMKVLIQGSESLLDEVTAVKAVVNVEGAKETISKSVSLQVYGENGLLEEADVKPEVVDVKVPIASPNAVVPLKVDIGKYPPAGYAVQSISPNVDEVTVYGPKAYVLGLDYYLGPKLDLSDANKDRTYELPLPIRGDAVKVEPESVEIAVDIVKGETKKIDDVPIKINGLEEGEQVGFIQPATQKVDLTLFGAPSLLENVDRGDIEAYIDAGKLSTDVQEVPIQVSLPNYIRLSGDLDLKAKVQLTR
ncbi:CdaA regulatory protein CdaR [Marinithermofilum abyssi]|uniref:CdaA regulatory protein CdaR n=1 Tax=Marinithermofilum abyssi TaxID=1571185 RepID=A0A8J2VHL4_9BACL|nr:CdaR family protein [Marinithermofilum abyssi]GGE23444.1 CdaA regulatory protein CdaR [Marinithermofilum abyssi]